MRTKSKKIDTLLAHAGRDPEKNFGVVNPPVYHASTVLYPTAEDQVAHRSPHQRELVAGCREPCAQLGRDGRHPGPAGTGGGTALAGSGHEGQA